MLRRVPRRLLIAWAAVAVVVALVPLAFALGRSRHFTASVGIFPARVNPYPPVRDPAYYTALLSDRELLHQMYVNVGVFRLLQDNHPAVAQAFPGGPLRVTVIAGSPAGAIVIANALGHQLANATSRQLARQSSVDAARLRAQLGSAALTRRGKRRLRRRLGQIDALGRTPPLRIVTAPAVGDPARHSWADRVADALPGRFPERASPVGAVIAGLTAVAALTAIWILLLGPARVFSAAAPEDERSHD